MRFNSRVNALEQLARHLNLMSPDVMPTMTGPVTANCTEIDLEELTSEELRVVRKLSAIKAEVDQQHGLTPGLMPTERHGGPIGR